MESKQQERLQRWVNEKWRHGACPVCEENGYQVGAILAEIRPLGGVPVGAAGVYPVVPVNCVNCGYTVLINAIVAGVLTGSDEPDVEAVEDAAPPERADVA